MGWGVWRLPRRWGISVIVINRCELEGIYEGGATLEDLEKASSELGFEGFLRYIHIHRHALLALYGSATSGSPKSIAIYKNG